MCGRRSTLVFFGAVLLAVAALSCDDPTGPGTVALIATVEFQAVEGGCWSLLASDGTRYEPLALAEPFRVRGLEVEATVRRRNDVGTICQVGQVVEVVEIRALGNDFPPD